MKRYYATNRLSPFFLVHAEVVVGCLQKVAVGHDTIFNTWLPAGWHEIAPYPFSRSKARSGISDLNHETGSTNFFVIDTHFRELLQRLLPVEVEVSKRLFCSSFFRTSFLRP